MERGIQAGGGSGSKVGVEAGAPLKTRAVKLVQGSKDYCNEARAVP